MKSARPVSFCDMKSGSKVRWPGHISGRLLPSGLAGLSHCAFKRTGPRSPGRRSERKSNFYGRFGGSPLWPLSRLGGEFLVSSRSAQPAIFRGSSRTTRSSKVWPAPDRCHAEHARRGLKGSLAYRRAGRRAGPRSPCPPPRPLCSLRCLPASRPRVLATEFDRSRRARQHGVPPEIG